MKKSRVDTALDMIPHDGFLKLTGDTQTNLTSAQRAVLIRRGNELFNQGKIDQAKRIFVTTSYTDGMIRVGDLYMKQNQPLEAFRMYKLAPSPDKTEFLIEKMSQIISGWIKEELNIKKG
ncbi:hypothetical protein [Spirochaeta cellobiosiphila]|uniref:hypothetical protein n=1 Tax=Spirochaeta cellobiosiphila TaxID=504483 RepID=UPI0003F963B5|nr:hypothetical protein [Spirochaeta cellobiosiphila]